jgi:hypothetical protein
MSLRPSWSSTTTAVLSGTVNAPLAAAPRLACDFEYRANVAKNGRIGNFAMELGPQTTMAGL